MQRLLLLPFYQNWWTQQTSPRIFALFLLLYSLQLFNMCIYFSTADTDQPNVRIIIIIIIIFLDFDTFINKSCCIIWQLFVLDRFFRGSFNADRYDVHTVHCTFANSFDEFRSRDYRRAQSIEDTKVATREISVWEIEVAQKFAYVQFVTIETFAGNILGRFGNFCLICRINERHEIGSWERWRERKYSEQRRITVG